LAAIGLKSSILKLCPMQNWIIKHHPIWMVVNHIGTSNKNWWQPFIRYDHRCCEWTIDTRLGTIGIHSAMSEPGRYGRGTNG
jgi:hypothetical protein